MARGPERERMSENKRRVKCKATHVICPQQEVCCSNMFSFSCLRSSVSMPSDSKQTATMQ